MGRDCVTEPLMRRLPRYYRCIVQMEKEGKTRISSQQLAQRLQLTASQIRHDLNCFGKYGQQGFGYSVAELKNEIMKILGIDRKYNAIIVGAGNLGQALANYQGFERDGVYIKAMFDVNPRLTGMAIRGIPILDIDEIEEYITKNRIDIGIITTPFGAAQTIADRLVGCGIKGIWNFTQDDIKVDKDIIVENVYLSDSLCMMLFQMRELKENRHKG